MKKPILKIPGFTGITNTNLVLRFVGKKDYTAGMLTEDPAGLTSPWLQQKARLYEAYLNHLFRDEAKKLAPLHEEAASIQDELKHLAGMPLAESKEETARRTAACTTRTTAIQHRLAEINAKVETMYHQFRWLVAQADAIYAAKTMAYWRGIVHACNDPLPAVPAVPTKIPDIDNLYAPTLMLIKED